MICCYAGRGAPLTLDEYGPASFFVPCFLRPAESTFHIQIEKILVKNVQIVALTLSYLEFCLVRYEGPPTPTQLSCACGRTL